jgi:hypothetical protein
MHARPLRTPGIRTLAAALAVAALASGPAGAATLARIAIQSGSGQHARAWAAPGTKLYETQFAGPLVVAVSPPDAKVRFRCTTAGCILPPQEQGEGIDRVDARTFDVDAKNGVAAIKLIVRSVSVQTISILAQAAGEPHGRAVRFELRER